MSELVALGDSHARVFHRIAELALLPAEITVCAVPGATALGMVNPFSKTNARYLFNELLDRTPTSAAVVTLLGETDCGFLIWWRADRLSVPVEEQLELSVQRYGEMLAGIQERGHERIVALSPPLPTLTDKSQGEVAHARREITATLIERTELTLRYAAGLERECAALGVRYANLIPHEFDPETRVIRESMRSPDPLDHHHDLDVYARLIANALDPD